MPKSECPLFSLEGPQHAEYQCDQCEINELDEMHDEALARIAELEAMVVWVVNKSAYCENGELSWIVHQTQVFNAWNDMPCDGTPASILAAVQQAMKA